MSKLALIVLAFFLLAAAACGTVAAPDVSFQLPDDNQGPDYGAPTP